ncbi:hypothetical protein EMIT0194P_180110 [Pseudomonas serbica]
MNQYPLPLFQLCVIEQSAPCRQRGQWHSGCLDVAQVLGFQGDRTSANGDVLRIAPAYLDVPHAEHFIARFEAVDPGAHFLHRPGKIRTGNEGQGKVDETFEPARAELEVRRVDTRRMDSHQDLVGPYARSGDFIQDKLFRLSVLMEANRLHISLPSSLFILLFDRRSDNGIPGERDEGVFRGFAAFIQPLRTANKKGKIHEQPIHCY